MSYQALYRRYRPRQFEEVVGQEHITTVLKNQIQSARAAHAYLFCGSRGTGKTTTAKIFARAINCLSPVEGEACGTCAHCKIMEEDVVDIIEIDAASNNGVDDVRALIEQSRYTPLHLKYKVYIIDEVHMLSSSASNALLKTLEEPPAHVLFLLATTEPQKILPTVISRCQRFDFRRLSIADITRTLKDVLQRADAHIDDEGILTIARAADGGMRDALSLADQCIAFCAGNATAKDVYDVLGSMDSDFLFKMADALLASQAAAALRSVDEIACSGRDLGVFAQDLSMHMRALLLAQACGDCSDLLDCTPEIMKRYEKQAKSASQERLLRALELLTKAQNEMKWLGKPRILLEAMLVRICRPEDENAILALGDRITQLEKTLEAGAMPVLSVQAIQAPPPPSEEPEEYDAPPWEEASSLEIQEAECPVVEQEKERPVPAKTKIAQKDAILEKAPEANGNGDLWEALKKALQTQNISLYAVAKHAQSSVREGNLLKVYFPSSKENSQNMLNRNLVQVKEALKQIDPVLDIQFLVQRPVATDAQTKDLLDLFGDKLKIEE